MPLIVASLGTAFLKDPAITLRDFIKNNYTILSPPVASVKFDTKFGNLLGFNFVIVENMPKSISIEALGASRYRIADTKRIQIFCQGKSAIDNRWKIEEHIESIINSNPTGMISDGIEQATITGFDPILVSDSALQQGLSPNEGVSRSRALVTLFYDKVKQ